MTEKGKLLGEASHLLKRRGQVFQWVDLMGEAF